ncbi:ADP-ribosylation factor GTPase-activating protein 2 isoform X1 [Onthophagus taurus]|uniref:ADP-ribosylation factor GTPase-activating protein 2 isoform X1 n=1 Tax=Onthophagus taurus TaxID=166361 RepID=UPI0039BE64A1
MELGPTASQIDEVFHRLRAIPANKMCFDCNAKNPTWSSVTYGVFICIDCSAVHRSLGVHLTFVRSTQLDTNWTWVQLRQMQLGGNSNALQFFNQHNCNTTDAQKKYNSRGAQLYRDKLNQLALTACKNTSELHLQPHIEDPKEDKEVDFFSEHENFVPEEYSLGPPQPVIRTAPQTTANTLLEEGPKVDFSTHYGRDESKSNITSRKPASRKPGLGGKKGGLGAQRVKTNFADIERQAALAEESRLRAHEEAVKAAELSEKEKEERDAAVRLAYKDLSVQQQQKEEQMKKVDPKKAEQLERLGMGLNTRSGISHSAFSDMKTITQENAQTSSSAALLSKMSINSSLDDKDGFFDEYSFSSGFSMDRNSGNSTNKTLDYLLSQNKSSSSSSNWGSSSNVGDDFEKIDKPKPRMSEKHPRSVDNSDIAQKKFGQAKAISSDQFFNDNRNDYEAKMELSKYQGSTSISSADLFGNGNQNQSSNQSFHTPDLDDVRESVRQGVTKVAGKISSLANGVMSSLQEKYGY